MDKQLIEEEKNEIFERGGAFEELIRTKGWGFIKAYYQNRVQALANGVLVADDQPITSFENERRELIGIRKMLGHIDSTLISLAALRKDKKEEEVKDEE